MKNLTLLLRMNEPMQWVSKIAAVCLLALILLSADVFPVFAQPLSTHSDIDAYLRVGSSELMLENYQGAIEKFNQAIEISSSNPIAYLNRGVARFALQDIQGAFEDLDQALQLNPEFAEGYTVRGGIRLQTGEQSLALEDFNHALQLNPAEATAYIGRAIIRARLHDRAGATRDYQKATELFAERGDSDNYQRMQNTLKKLQ